MDVLRGHFVSGEFVAVCVQLLCDLLHLLALHDVLAYKEQRSRARREALDEMTADAVDMGLYDEAIRRGREARTHENERSD